MYLRQLREHSSDELKLLNNQPWSLYELSVPNSSSKLEEKKKGEREWLCLTLAMHRKVNM
jgi:hypothetical protein